MDQPTKMTPKDFFLYAGLLFTLYCSAGAFLSLVFDLINIVVPDALSYSYYSSTYSIRFAISALIIVFPLYVVLGYFVGKDISRAPEKAGLAVRKWFVYFTLFVAGAVVAGDLITLINTFLGGEVSLRFILKVITVLLVAGIIFSYYLYDLKRDRALSSSNNVVTGFRIGASALVLAAIVASFFVVDSPATARKRAFDTERVGDLQTIQWQVINYWQQKGAVPSKLSDLEDSISGFRASVDPETNKEYEFKKTGVQSFSLCADFSLKSEGNNGSDPYSYVYPTDTKSQNWAHESGRVCFDRTIDKDLYPINKPGAPVQY